MENIHLSHHLTEIMVTFQKNQENLTQWNCQKKMVMISLSEIPDFLQLSDQSPLFVVSLQVAPAAIFAASSFKDLAVSKQNSLLTAWGGYFLSNPLRSENEDFIGI